MSYSKASMKALVAAAGRGDLSALEKVLTALTSDDYGDAPITIGANTTIDSKNASNFNGRTLVFSGAFTLTISAGLPTGFGIACVPPAAGNASIASDGTATLNGAGATLTRAAASNVAFSVIASGTNAYAVTGA